MNMSNRIMPWVFPLTLALLMGGVTFWLNRATDVNIETTLLDVNKPQYVMHDIKGMRFDATGKMAESLVAQKAQMYPDSEDVWLFEPKGHTYVNGQQLYHIQSQEARYSDENEKIFFKQDVIFTKTSADGGLEGQVLTPSLVIDIPTQTAQTDQEVQYRYGQSHGSATGFSYDKKNDVLHLQSRVKAIIYDEQP